MKPFRAYLLAGACLLFSGPKPAPPFEGEIDYAVHFDSKVPTMDSTRMQLLFGDQEQYFIRGARYKTMMDGQVVEMQLYDPADNRLYTKMPESDTLLWNDASVNRDSILSFSIKRNADTILGYPCDELFFTSVSGTSRYTYSKALPLNAGEFKQHLYGNWAFYCEKAGALPLRMVVETAQLKMTAEASMVRPQRLDSAFFAVPKGFLLPARNF